MSQAHGLLRELRAQLDALPTQADVASEIADYLVDPSDAWETAGLITARFGLTKIEKGRVDDGKHR
jgi:hypothetical protein